jgi:hypothetical protein
LAFGAVFFAAILGFSFVALVFFVEEDVLRFGAVAVFTSLAFAFFFEVLAAGVTGEAEDLAAFAVTGFESGV